jgi:hypothetical protein
VAIKYSRFAFVPIAGLPGSGKSDLVAKLNEQGEQVLSIEEIAGLQGVCLADLFGESIVEQAEFERRLAARLHGFADSRCVYVEWKKPEVTGYELPSPLMTQVRAAPAAYVDEPREVRALNLMTKYSEWSEHIDLLLVKLPRRGVDPKLIGELSHAARQSTLTFVETLLSKYLDPLYEQEIEKLNIVWRGPARDLPIWEEREVCRPSSVRR